MTRIDELDRELPVATTVVEPHHGHAPAATYGGRGNATRWLVAALVVQTFGLALLGALHWGRAPTDGEAPAGFRTLASAPTAPASAAAVRVVFAPGTNVEQVAALLRDIDARIVDGPSPAGTYALALAVPAAGEADPVAMAIGRLRADARIVFAEPIR